MLAVWSWFDSKPRPEWNTQFLFCVPNRVWSEMRSFSFVFNAVDFSDLGGDAIWKLIFFNLLNSAASDNP